MSQPPYDRPNQLMHPVVLAGAMRALVIALLVPALLASTPASAASVPSAIGGDTEMVGGHAYQEFLTGRYCTSSDPALGLVNTDVASTLQHVETVGVTTYTIHLDATPAGGDCAAIDLVIDASAAWPADGASSWGSFSAACGATGTIQAYRATSAIVVLSFANVPVACGWSVASYSLVYMSIRPVHPSTGAVCMPVIVPSCSGATDGALPWSSCGGSYFAVSAADFTLVYASHGCYFGPDGEKERAYFSPALGILWIEATSDECWIRYDEGATGVRSEVACPEEVRQAVYEQDWTAILP